MLFSFQCLSESCFGNDNNFFLTQPMSCFVFNLIPNLLITQNVFTQPFSLRKIELWEKIGGMNLICQCMRMIFAMASRCKRYVQDCRKQKNNYPKKVICFNKQDPSFKVVINLQANTFLCRNY